MSIPSWGKWRNISGQVKLVTVTSLLQNWVEKFSFDFRKAHLRTEMLASDVSEN